MSFAIGALSEKRRPKAVDQLTASRRRDMPCAIADARTRTPKKAAWKKFDDFLVSCVAVNDRSELPFYVKKVWLFGSMIDPAQVDVGDFDFVVETGRRVDASKSRKIYKRLAKGLRINTDS